MRTAAVGGNRVGGSGNGAFRDRQDSGPDLRPKSRPPKRPRTSPDECATGKPSSVGWTCWPWQRLMAERARRLGVTWQRTQRRGDRRREIDWRVSG